MIKRFFAQEWVAWVFMITCMVLAIVFGWKQKPKIVNDKSGLLTQDTIDDILKTTETESSYDEVDYAIYIAEDDSKLEKHAKKEASKLKFGEDDYLLAISLAKCKMYIVNGDEIQSFELDDDGLRKSLIEAYHDKDYEKINENVNDIVTEFFSQLNDSGDEHDTSSEYDGFHALAEGGKEFAESAANTATGLIGWILGLAGKILSKLAKLGFWGIVIVFIIISSIFGKKK